VTSLEILSTGPLALVQDHGRPGFAHVGVTRSGAADRAAHALANRLVANHEAAATLEITLGGLRFRVHGGPLHVAVTGADARPAVDGMPFGVNNVQRIGDGQVLTLTTPASGLRSYLGVRGGIDVAPTLGSRSFDTLSGIGPRPLRPGDMIPVGPAGDGFPGVEQAPVAPVTGGPVDIGLIPGPRDDWFTDPDALIRTAWVTSDRSDRVAVRLSGRALRHRWPDRQLPSEGAARGAVQMPPNGQPVIFGPDHPVTGGYPVIGVVADADVDKVGQLRPGQPVRLHWIRARIATPDPSGW
jgi:biotin-dependent carboxylase-like uncharacterized protein